MLKPLTLAILSDVHAGRGTRARDLCPHSDGTGIDSDFRGRFLKFLHQHRIRADYLLIAGDASHEAHPTELKIVSEFIKEIARALSIRLGQVAFVPGNHDVDWSVLAGEDATGFKRSQRYAPLRNREWVFNGLFRRARYGILEPNYFCIWDSPDVLVVGYNSSWHDDAKDPVHHGLVAQEHIIALDEALSGLDLSPERLKIFMAHHHPLPYSDPVPDEPDFSGMTNAQNLLGVLRKHQFDLLVHGHRHAPNFQTQIVDSGFPLAVLCAGSFSASLDPRWSGYVNNQFHLVKVAGRDDTYKAIFGVIESWAYLCKQGWIQSQKHNGIRHRVPFGTYLQFHELSGLLRPVLLDHLSRRTYTRWSDVTADLPRLEHLPTELVLQVLQVLGNEMSFDTHEGLDGIVLLAKEH